MEMDIKENVRFVFLVAVALSTVICVWTGIYIYFVFLIGGMYVLYTVYHGGIKLKEIHSKKELDNHKTIVNSKAEEDLIGNVQQITAIVQKTTESEQNTLVQIAQERAKLIANKTKEAEDLQRFRHSHLENVVALSEQEKDALVDGKCNELMKKVNTETAKKVQETTAKNEQILAEIKSRMDKQRQINADRMNATVNNSNAELNCARNRYRI